jgi:hypothetical protein
MSDVKQLLSKCHSALTQHWKIWTRIVQIIGRDQRFAAMVLAARSEAID